MRNIFMFAVATLALAAAARPAHAYEEDGYQYAQGGVACQLSIPTTDTKVRPKASGYRNEGNTNAFAICGMPAATGTSMDGHTRGITIEMHGINGVASSVSCTAVNGAASVDIGYSTKAVSLDAAGNSAFLNFDASDFGGTPGDVLPHHDTWSITCLLPGNAAIGQVFTNYKLVILE
jgi:hypothetical protein